MIDSHASEVIRDGLRTLEDQTQMTAMKLEALRADIQRGISSGTARPVADVRKDSKKY